MPIDLGELLDPRHTAVLTMEMQRGVAGDLAAMPALADAVERGGVVPAVVSVLGAARAAGARVAHCTVAFRPDRAGSAANAPMLAAVLRNPEHLLAGSPAAELVPGLGPEPGDLVSVRSHGVSPFTGTELDAWLRNLGVRSVVATGVSLNLGIVGLAVEAVNLGYRVAVVTDAVAGVPDDYAQAVLANTVALVATRVTATEVVAAWA